MDITLEQARVLEAVARLGTIQKAAEELNRGHSFVLYSLKCLEDQTRLTLFDRAGHRNRLTVEGGIVLIHCRKLLDARAELANICYQIREGWEPSLKLIYDEVIDFNLIGSALFELNQSKPPTEIKALSAHLDQVEMLFQSEKAEIMVTILPFRKLQIPFHRMQPIHMHLVAHRGHGVCKKTRGKLTTDELNQHTFVTIKSSAGPLQLSTEELNFSSHFFVNSFVTKKIAIMNRLGFGWLPDYLIEDELKKGSLEILNTEIDNKTSLSPKLYHRPEGTLGRAAKNLISFLRSSQIERASR